MFAKMSTMLAIAAAVALPATSDARNSPEAAVDACVKSFVGTYLSEHPVKQVKKRIPARSPLDVLSSRSFTVELSARGAQTGTIYAQARCVGDDKGVVLVEELP